MFHVLYYDCIFTIITFHEWNYVKCALKEIDLAWYPDKLLIVSEAIVVDIMDVQIDYWVAVTFFFHSCLSITLPIYILGIDSLIQLFRRGEWRVCLGYGERGGGGDGDCIEVTGGLPDIFISVAIKTWNISPYIWL